jgi:putative flippase GtrA
MNRDTSKTIFVFICVGLFVATFQYVSFYVLFEQLKNSYLVSTSVSFCLTVLVSYLSQKYVTFRRSRTDEGHKKQVTFFILFALNSVWGLILNGGIMFVGVDILNQSAYLAQFVSMGILALYNFFVYRALLG